MSRVDWNTCCNLSIIWLLVLTSTTVRAQTWPASQPAAAAIVAEAERIDPSHHLPYQLPADEHEREQKVADVARVVRQYMSLPPGTFGAHPSAAGFPGVVDATIQQRQDVKLSFSSAVPRWQTTGLYANAGEVVTVRFPQGIPSDAGKVSIVIGCHRDGLLSARQTRWERFPSITRTFPVADKSGESLKIANAFGGPIFVEFSNAKAGAKSITISFEHVVREPLFVLGQTTVDQWHLNRSDPAPWAELVAKKVILHVPSAQARAIDDPTALLQWWDQVVTLEDELVDWPARQSQERIVPDVQISAGWMHSGYPVMCHLASAPDMTNFQKLSRQGDWGFFHELGHNHQSSDWTFDGQTEVTVNLFTLYVMEKLVGQRCGDPGTCMSNYRELLAKRFADSPAEGPFEQLAPFVVLIRHFGFDELRATLITYRHDPIARKLDEPARQAIFVRRYSENAGHNLVPFFRKMGYKIDDGTSRQLEQLPPFEFDTDPQ
jgi:hypothetical protein